MRDQVLKEHHDELTAGHTSNRKPIYEVCSYNRFPGMLGDIVGHVGKRVSLQQYKQSNLSAVVEGFILFIYCLYMDLKTTT